MSNALPALSINQLRKRYGAFTAVRDVTLDVQPGEIFALLGPNGAGKTTMIQCVAGLVRPSGGSIHVFGHDIRTSFRTTRRLVGVVPQEIAFDPFFTPHESLLIQMGLMGVRPDPGLADELLGRMALLDKRDAYARHLSGGMKRRLLVAKALVHAPKLLFLDEPTAGVDVELRRDLWGEVRRLRDEGTTIILTTHYLEEAEALADRIGMIRNGELILVQDKAEMIREYGRSVVRFRTGSPRTDPDLPFPTRRLPDGLIEADWQTPDDLQKVIAQASAVLDITGIDIQQARLEDIFMSLISQTGGSADLPTAGGAS